MPARFLCVRRDSQPPNWQLDRSKEPPDQGPGDADGFAWAGKVLVAALALELLLAAPRYVFGALPHRIAWNTFQP